MSLKKKIAIGFLISSSIIASLVIFEYVNFIEIKQQIRYLELTDTLRSKSLQLRRHEKNFLMYSPEKAGFESQEVHRYIRELHGLVGDNINDDKSGTLARLKYLVDDYEKGFDTIQSEIGFIGEELDRKMRSGHGDPKFFPYIRMTFMERPGEAADLLEKVFGLPPDDRLITSLRGLGAEITRLRKNGEDIILVAKEYDKSARDHVDRMISISQTGIFVLFPLFLIVGIGTKFYFVGSITKRLKVLSEAMDMTGVGPEPYKAVGHEDWRGTDEVGQLMSKFDHMEELLSQREEEINKKNAELLHQKKLVAIGTLASGVAHELNNPLNNIYISAQVLEKEAGSDCSPAVKEVVGDILGQTARVKRIVGDLLEYARGREPNMRPFDLAEAAAAVYRLLGTTTAYGTRGVDFSMNSPLEGAVITADPEQMERVFINLFTNAIDAMEGQGRLTVNIIDTDAVVEIKVSDSGKGIGGESLENIFEPFYTTKDKGTGLGLAIVFNIIKKHNGDITVVSEPGRGTTFTIILPKQLESS
ncbi:MAG: GHKL domain-containing protein [Nitrospirae bacterium]|nr:GHKL domain-containing protein [Nitrospirota bacterium]MBI5695844.1 GHKL domain-containing protein [Nitrospirota bacterium]